MAAGLKLLRPHQQRALDGLKSSLLAGHRRPVLQAPTGAGKTVIAAHIVAGAMAKGKRVCFCVPSISLVDQTFARFCENGIDPANMGIIQANHPWRRPAAPIQIATAQTLVRRDRPEVDFVVIDEAHVRHAVYEAWMTDPACSSMIFIGLTATPWARGMGLIFDDLIRPTSLRELIAEGYLAPFRVFAPSHPDLRGVRTVAGDYHEGQLSERMREPKLVGDVVSTWLAKASSLPTLCFAVDRAHARMLHEQFEAAGVSAAYVDAETPREERVEIGKKLAAGDVRVVVNIGTLTTGVDWDVRCIILARPTKSEILFVQIIGRGLRTAPGKDECLILDHSDTHLRLGMVTDIDHDTLDDGTRRSGASGRDDERREPLPWECPQCAAVVPARVSACVNCGHVRRRVSHVLSEDGDLAEISHGGRRGERVSVRDQLAAQGKEAIYGQLLWVMDRRGRSQGWAAHAYREIFGVWPRGLPRNRAYEPTPLLRSWIRSRDIAYARSRGRHVGMTDAHGHS